MMNVLWAVAAGAIVACLGLVYFYRRDREAAESRIAARRVRRFAEWERRRAA